MRSELARLLDATEENAKRIEAILGSFPAVVLNEWRYATRHVVNLLEGDGDETERRKAEDHVARAYFDSCDILLDCLLDRAREYSERYDAYPEILNAAVKDYPSVLAAIRSAHAAHKRSQGFVEADKRERYAELSEHIKPLSDAIDALDAAAPTIAAACRREKQKAVLTVVALVTGILSLAATIAATVIAILR